MYKLIPAAVSIIIIAVVGVLHLTAQAQQQTQHQQHHDHIITPQEQIEYRDGPPSLPSGVQYTVLEGDPSQEGFFTMRLKAPPGYRIPPHTHPRTERVTVLAGTFRIGMGSRFNENELQDLPAGSFFVMPPGMQHFAATGGDEETVVQLNAQGPWDIQYVNPEDDPRRRR